MPGTGIGMLLMILGLLGVRVCEALEPGDTLDRRRLERKMVTYIVLGVSVGVGFGVSLGLMFGSVALGIAAGPLVGLAVAMGVWLRRQTARDA